MLLLVRKLKVSGEFSRLRSYAQLKLVKMWDNMSRVRKQVAVSYYHIGSH